MHFFPTGMLREARSAHSRLRILSVTRNAGPKLAFLFALLLMAAPALLAQFGGSLNGTVTDPSGAVVPGATVKLTNPATQATKTATTNGTGFYSFTELPPGNYTVTVTSKGFKEQDFTDVAVTAEQPRGLDVKMTAGGASETVTVNGNQTPILNTTDAEVASTISTDDVTRLPTFGRDPYELLRTGVGITGDSARSGSGGAIALPNNSSQNQSNVGIFQTENQIQISASGQRVTSNTYEIDGVTVDSLLHGGSTIITPSIESVAQITVLAANYDATLGRDVGAHILTVTKAGGNDFHGTLFFQYDEPGLNAYQSYGGPTSTPGVFAPPVRNDFQQRDWAASIGGPIKKNKLFWFGSYEAAKSTQQSFSETYVPTTQWYAALAAARPTGLVAGTVTKPAGQVVVKAVLPGACTAIQTQCAPAGTGIRHWIVWRSGRAVSAEQQCERHGVGSESIYGRGAGRGPGRGIRADSDAEPVPRNPVSRTRGLDHDAQRPAVRRVLHAEAGPGVARCGGGRGAGHAVAVPALQPVGQRGLHSHFWTDADQRSARRTTRGSRTTRWRTRQAR